MYISRVNSITVGLNNRHNQWQDAMITLSEQFGIPFRHAKNILPISKPKQKIYYQFPNQNKKYTTNFQTKTKDKKNYVGLYKS